MPITEDDLRILVYTTLFTEEEYNEVFEEATGEDSWYTGLIIFKQLVEARVLPEELLHDKYWRDTFIDEFATSIQEEFAMNSMDHFNAQILLIIKRIFPPMEIVSGLSLLISK